MKKPGWSKLWVPIFVCCTVYSLALPFAYGADKPNKQEIVKQARQAYYSLRDRGLTEFQSNVQPNWKVALKDLIATNPASAEPALKMLNGIHFMVSLGPDGAVKVTHRVDVAPPNEKSAEGFNQIFSGMEQTMSGFFDTWKPFMLTTPFPEIKGDYHLEELDNQYHLSYKEGAADVATTMSRELVISEIKVDSPAFKSVLKPVFTRSPQGFLLTGYDATYQEPGNTGVRLNVLIDYQQVNGFQLPNKLNLNGTYNGTPFAVELTFNEYQVKKQ